VPSSEVRFWHELATPGLAAWLLWAARGVLLEAGELVDVGREGAEELLAPLIGDALSSGRQRDSLLVALEGAIAAFRRHERCDLPSLRVRRGLPRTLVVLGSLHEQARHAPWFTVLLDVMLEAASRHTDEVLVILDEVANLAPVSRLAQVASVGLGLGLVTSGEVV